LLAAHQVSPRRSRGAAERAALIAVRDEVEAAVARTGWSAGFWRCSARVVLPEGVPGVAKTLLVRALAQRSPSTPAGAVHADLIR
jgi:hypothetical protein